MGKGAKGDRVSRAIVEPMESRRLMSTVDGFEMGPDDTKGVSEARQLTSNDDGAWAFAYRSGSSFRVRSSGGADFALTASNADDMPEVDAAGGNFVAAWAEKVSGGSSNAWTIKASVMSFPSGSTQPRTTTVTVASGKGLDANVGGVAIGRNGIVVMYSSINMGLSTTQQIQRLSLTGTKVGKPIAGGGTVVDMNTSDDSFVIASNAYSDNSTNVVAQRYSSSGAKVGGLINVAVDPAIDEEIADLEIDYRNGDFVVSYGASGSDSTVRAVVQRVSASGQLAGPAITLKEGAAFGTGTQEAPQVEGAPAIDVSPDGSFVASWGERWMDRYFDDAGNRLYTDIHTSVLLQRFAADGTQLGAAQSAASAIARVQYHYDENGTQTFTRSGDGVDAEEVASLGNGSHLVSFTRLNETLQPLTRWGQTATAPATLFSSEAINDTSDDESELLPVSH